MLIEQSYYINANTKIVIGYEIPASIGSLPSLLNVEMSTIENSMDHCRSNTTNSFVNHYPR